MAWPNGMSACKNTAIYLCLSSQDAFVEYLDGPHLFNSMFADDADTAKLTSLPGVPTLCDAYPYPARYSV